MLHSLMKICYFLFFASKSALIFNSEVTNVLILVVGLSVPDFKAAALTRSLLFIAVSRRENNCVNTPLFFSHIPACISSTH